MKKLVAAVLIISSFCTGCSPQLKKEKEPGRPVNVFLDLFVDLVEDAIDVTLQYHNKHRKWPEQRDALTRFAEQHTIRNNFAEYKDLYFKDAGLQNITIIFDRTVSNLPVKQYQGTVYITIKGPKAVHDNRLKLVITAIQMEYDKVFFDRFQNDLETPFLNTVIVHLREQQTITLSGVVELGNFYNRSYTRATFQAGEDMLYVK